MTCSRPLALAAALACALAAGCAEDHRGAIPRVGSVAPAAGYASEETPIVVRGEGFRVEPYQTAAGRPEVDATFRLSLGGTELAAVAWVSERELRARVPAGLAPGAHRLELRDPRGAVAVLEDAYTAVAGAPAALAVAAAIAPAVASLGQPVTVRVDVTNTGGAPVRAVSPAISIAGDALSLSPDPPAQVDVGPGETRTFFLAGTAAAGGSAEVAAGAAGTDDVTGRAVVAPNVSAGSLLVQPTSLLSASGQATPARASVGQLVVVEVTYGNAPGVAAVEGLQPALSATVGGGAVSLVAAPPPCDLPGGGTCVARFVLRAERAGGVEVQIDAAGIDANSGAPAPAPRATVALVVEAGPSLSAAAAVSPARANVGQPLTLSIAVTNGGDVAARDVAVSVLAAPVAAQGGPAPAPQDVPAGETRTFAWEFVPRERGVGAFVVAASGEDANGAGPVASGPALSSDVVVESPASLAAAFEPPPPTSPTIGFAVTLEVTNAVQDPEHGQADAIGVEPGALSVVEGPGFLAASEVSCTAVDAGPADLAAGAAAVFRWTCSATRLGQVRLEAVVTGTDGNDGAPLGASAVATYALDEAAEIAADPFGDGTSFSFVFAYDGHVFLGPSGDGRGVVRCAPDGSGCASFTFSFAYDTSETVSSVRTGVSRNAPPIGCATPVTTLGAAGYCDADNPTSTACFCGPDLESGRGLFSSFRLGAAQDEWLVAMGRNKKMGELNYAYMTRDTTTPLAFSYADLYVAMPPAANVEDVVSLTALNDRLYFGLQVETTGDGKLESTDGPRVAVLARTPEPPGLDAISEADAFAMTFQATPMGENGGSAVITQMDAMIGFEGRLFVANRKAVLVSRTGAPAANLPDGSVDFEDCTPQLPAEWLASGIAGYTGKVDVTPADKGVTALAAWAGRLYLARNTRAGVPELWVLTPRRDGGGAFLGCAADRTDWRRIATSLGGATRTHATALFASDRFLYYGMDDATAGLALFRTASPAPESEADFTGRQGCVAPCTPLGGEGFGDPANGRFFDARALALGATDEVWATVGDGASAVRVYRIAEE